MPYHKYVFFSLFFMTHQFLSGSMYHQTNVNEYMQLCAQPEYKELANKFTQQKLLNVLSNLEKNAYNGSVFQQWSRIADQVIGISFCEAERRHFLVSVILHADQNSIGLQTLDYCFQASQPNNQSQSIDTPNGPIGKQIHADQYENAMQVSAHIRNTMFGEDDSRKAKPLVLVDKVDYRMNIALKWFFFKAAAVIVHLVASQIKKDEKNEKKRKDDSKTLEGSFAIADFLQTIEKLANQELENKYPILKTHEVKSLIGEKTWWLYDRKNWITMAGIGGMALILLAIMHDKIPYIPYYHHHSSVIIIT